MTKNEIVLAHGLVRANIAEHVVVAERNGSRNLYGVTIIHFLISYQCFFTQKAAVSVGVEGVESLEIDGWEALYNTEACQMYYKLDMWKCNFATGTKNESIISACASGTTLHHVLHPPAGSVRRVWQSVKWQQNSLPPRIAMIMNHHVFTEYTCSGPRWLKPLFHQLTRCMNRRVGTASRTLLVSRMVCRNALDSGKHRLRLRHGRHSMHDTGDDDQRTGQTARLP